MLGMEFRRTFSAGALSGRQPVEGGLYLHEGRLEGADLAEFQRAKGWIDYVVLSYATPIAWHHRNGWYVVSQKFSVTTSKHQGYVRAAISHEQRRAALADVPLHEGCDDVGGCEQVQTDCCEEQRWSCQTVSGRDGEYEDGLRLCQQGFGCNTEEAAYARMYEAEARDEARMG
jgi:hypothetical protein